MALYIGWFTYVGLHVFYEDVELHVHILTTLDLSMDGHSPISTLILPIELEASEACTSPRKFRYETNLYDNTEALLYIGLSLHSGT